MKVGRNDPCPCGSGKKYKKCCLSKDTMIVNDLKNFRLEEVRDPKEIERIRKEVEIKQGPEPHINLVPSIIWKGYRWRTIYSTLHARNLHETFHEFILVRLKSHFGPEWKAEQDKLPPEKQHILLKWLRALNKLSVSKSAVKEGEHLWSAEATGPVRALNQFAYDVYCLESQKKLPDFLIKKIKNYNEFQGARYEIATAAIMLRAGYEIEFLDDKHLQEKHCEFIAKHRLSGISYGVEAKSRRRKGVMHEAGEFDASKDVKGDVRNLLKKAITQRPKGMPFIIFIDLNLPPEPNVKIENRKWFGDIKNLLDERGNSSDMNPDPFNALTLTNFSYYYQGDDEVASGGEYLQIIGFHPENKVYKNFPVQDIQPLEDIRGCLDRYSYIPKEV